MVNIADKLRQVLATLSEINYRSGGGAPCTRGPWTRGVPFLIQLPRWCQKLPPTSAVSAVLLLLELLTKQHCFLDLLCQLAHVRNLPRNDSRSISSSTKTLYLNCHQKCNQTMARINCSLCKTSRQFSFGFHVDIADQLHSL